MMRRFPPSLPSAARGHVGLATVFAVAALTLAACGGGSSDPASAVSISGASDSWVLHDGQTVAVSMGANHVFAPLSHVNIIECADPGGTRANLPTKFLECDENTIQGDTVVVSADGSFKEKSYTIYALPNAPALGEPKDGVPVCNATHQCVLLISEFQTDLSKPKVFSHSFTVDSRGTNS